MPIPRSYRRRDPQEVTGFSQAWTKQSYEEQEDDISALVSSIHALNIALRSPESGARRQNTSTGATLAETDDCLALMNGALHKMFETKFFNCQHGSGDMTADHFFDVAEICERVLMGLDLVDVLAMQQVSKRIFAVIEGSVKLQRKLHLRPDLEARQQALEFRSCDATRIREFEDRIPNLRNLKIQTDPERCHSYTYGWVGRATVSIKLDYEDYARLRSPGERIRQMLICQPPPTVMDVEISCCGDTSMAEEEYIDREPPDDNSSYDGGEAARREEKFRYHAEKLSKIKNERGVTVGDVWDACLQLAREHELCPQAGETAHDDDGWVKCGFQFDGILPKEPSESVETVESESPRDYLNNHPHYWKERYVHGYLMHRYVSYKRRVAHSGFAIPTFAEFKEDNGHLVEEAWNGAEHGRGVYY